MSDGVRITFVMHVKPEFSAQLNEAFVASLPQTRAFSGCRYVEVYRNDDDPHKIILIEEWGSKEDYARYLAWRNEDGTMDRLAAMLSRPSSPQYWSTRLA